MPAPTSSRRRAWSNTATRKPCWAMASAAARPPMPAAATMTVREEPTADFSASSKASGSDLCRQRAVRRARGMGIEGGVVAEQCRAIGADDLGGVAHVEEHVRMVHWRQFPHAHELLRADLDDRH